MSLYEIKKEIQEYKQLTNYRLKNKWRWDGWNVKAFQIELEALNQMIQTINKAEHKKEQIK